MACESEERKPQGGHYGGVGPGGAVLELYNGKGEGGKAKRGGRDEKHHIEHLK